MSKFTTSLNTDTEIQLHSPMHTLLENVGHEVENIDFIYFERAFSNEVRPQKGEYIGLLKKKLKVMIL
mgnify:FL=1